MGNYKESMAKKVSMTSPKGMCSYKSNPVSQPSRTPSEFGPGMNPDQKKANKLLKEAHKKNESLRGMGVM